MKLPASNSGEREDEWNCLLVCSDWSTDLIGDVCSQMMNRRQTTNTYVLSTNEKDKRRGERESEDEERRATQTRHPDIDRNTESGW